jgi:hypothetical protein
MPKILRNLISGVVIMSWLISIGQGSHAASWRHSASAAARFCLKRHLSDKSNQACEFNASLKDMKLFYDEYLVWLCWETAANESLFLNSLMRGKIQGISFERPSPPAQKPFKHETSLDEFPAIRTGNFLLQTGKTSRLTAK